MPNQIITMVPEGSEKRQLQSCTGKKCLWCQLTGHHSQTPEERTLLMKQAAVGILVLTILAFIVIVSVGMALKVIL